MVGVKGRRSRRDVADVVRDMREAAREAHGIEVTYATRDTTIDDVAVARGDAIGLLDGRLVVRSTEALDALERAARRLLELPRSGDGGRFQPEIVALYTGADVSDDQAGAAADRLRQALPGAEVEVRRGGQPHYPFIVQAE
jgi:hypothetical protein